MPKNRSKKRQKRSEKDLSVQKFVGTEYRDGKHYRVVQLPDAEPPSSRSQRTRYHMKDVEKEGNIDK